MDLRAPVHGFSDTDTYRFLRFVEVSLCDEASIYVNSDIMLLYCLVLLVVYVFDLYFVLSSLDFISIDTKQLFLFNLVIATNTCL